MADSVGSLNGYLLWQAANYWQRRMREVLAPHGVTPAQFLLLCGLHELDDAAGTAVNQVALARHCGTDPMMTSQVLRILETAGLLRRSIDAQDRRAVAVAITASGASLVRRAMAGVRDADARFHAPLAAHGDAFGDALQMLCGVKPKRRVRAQSG
ncbi:MAG: MarR family transcriptional regulator [Alphaproteobacteria bacterium]